MTDRRQKLGKWGEGQARRYLEAQGCPLVAANWRCSAGEVDLVVRDGDWLAFVEVRTRRGDTYGTPEESITATKLARMAAVAETYVYETEWEGDWRLDVVAIQVQSDHPPAIEWYKNVSM
jgi:putative endonuclease